MKRLFLCCLLLLVAGAVEGKNYSVTSPSGVLRLEVSVGDTTRYALSVAGSRVVLPSRIALQLADGRTLGNDARVTKAASGHKRRPVVRRRPDLVAGAHGEGRSFVSRRGGVEGADFPRRREQRSGGRGLSDRNAAG